MKISDTIDDTVVLWESKLDDNHVKMIMEPVAEGVGKLAFMANTKGGVVKNGGVLTSLNNNPFLVGLVAGAATSALTRYTKNKRLYTTRFFAKTPEEKKLYNKIVDDLMKTGQYKKVRNVHVDGGILWELQRKGVR